MSFPIHLQKLETTAGVTLNEEQKLGLLLKYVEEGTVEHINSKREQGIKPTFQSEWGGLGETE